MHVHDAKVQMVRGAAGTARTQACLTHHKYAHTMQDSLEDHGVRPK